MKKITITVLDEHGNELSDLFDNAPVTIPKDKWVDAGDYLSNMNEINFGKPTRDVFVGSFMMTTGIGFFSSAEVTPVGGGKPVEVKNDWELSVGPQQLDVDKKLVE